jgi:hypothetical protein
MKRRYALFSVLALTMAVVASCSSAGNSSPDQPSLAKATADKTIVPDKSWDCGMAGGIPRPESGTLLLEAEMKLDNFYDVGKTPFGQRQVAVTQTGTMNGPKIQASILAGGLDFELTLPNGVVEVEHILVLRTSDNRYAIMRNAGTGLNANDVRVVYDFEAPNAGGFAWLNTGKYVGRRTLDPATKTLKLTIYDVSSVAAPTDDAHAVRVTKPADVPPQPWSYRVAAAGEQRGDTIVTESVALGGSQAVAASKRGARNIIPITGGTLTGGITGKVLFGGADYQSPTTGPAIDARYLWRTTEGDIIIVRNAGPMNGLIPTFETRVDGKYAWLNSGKYLSSPPGMGGGMGGGLSITMYKSK